MKKHLLILIASLLVLSFLSGFFLAPKPREIPRSEGTCAAPNNQQAFFCAMHPQVQRKQKDHCPLCGMSLTKNPAIASMQSDLIQLPKQTARMLQVQTMTAKPITLARKVIPVSGRVKLDENRVFHQTANLPGRIEKLYVKEEGTYVKKGQPIASVYSKELIAVAEAFAFSRSSESIVRSAKNNMASWGITENQVKNMLAGSNFRKPVKIYADFSGTILHMAVREGDHAANTHMGSPTLMYELADLSRLWAYADLYEEDLAGVSPGSKLEFQVPAYPNKTFRATIDWISPVVDPHTRSVQVRATVDNRDRMLKPDMLIKGSITSSMQVDQGVTVPASAVLWTGRHSFVYLKNQEYPQEDIYQIRKVDLGEKINGDHYLILDGLEGGEEIVVHGAFQIDAAAQLAGKKSMMGGV